MLEAMELRERGRERARRTCIVDTLQMLEWYIAITSCCHSTHRPIFVKTSKRQRAKYMVPNRRASFTTYFPIGWPLFLIPCSGTEEPTTRTNNEGKKKHRSIQSDLPLDVSIDSETIMNSTYFVCIRVLYGLCMTIF